MRKISGRMHAQFSTIHSAAYLVRRRPNADGPVSTGHAPIGYIPMRPALQALGITDHPHEANTVSLRWLVKQRRC